jgi:lysozyme family protein
MQANYELFFQRVLKDEGTAYENVRGDSGGPTCCGINITDIARTEGVPLPKRGANGWDDLVAKVKAITPKEADTIYKRDYWDTLRGDDLPSGVDYAVVDYGVNSGNARSAETLNSLVGVKGDEITGDTLLGIRRYGSLEDLINHFQDERKSFLEKISREPKNRKFRNGWVQREARVRATALDLTIKASPLPPATKPPKPVEDDPVPPLPAGLPDRDTATVPDIRPFSRKLRLIAWLKSFLGIGSACTLVDQVNTAKGVSDALQSMVSNPVIIGMVCVSLAIIVVAGLLEEFHLQDYKRGDWTPSGNG